MTVTHFSKTTYKIRGEWVKNLWILPSHAWMDIANLHSSFIANLRKVRNEALWETEHDGCCDTYFIKCFLMECALLHIPSAVGAGSGREMRGASFLTNSPFYVWHTKLWFSWQSQNTSASIFPFGINGNPWNRKWQLTPVFLPGKSHGQRSLAGYSPWGRRVKHDWARTQLWKYLLKIYEWK